MSELVGAITGAAATALLGAAGSQLSYLRRRKRLLDVAALRCYDRFRKLEVTADEGSRANELFLLGGDLDRYLTAIAAARPQARRAHLELYDQSRQILITHELDQLARLSGSFEALLERRGWLSLRSSRGSAPRG